MGGSPNCVMIERSSKQSMLQVAPVSSWQAKVVVKSSSADLKKLTSANHCFALVCTRETVSTCRQLSSELSSSSSNCCTFLDERLRTQNGPFCDTYCTFALTRDTLLFVYDNVYDHNTCMSVQQNFRNSYSRFSSLSLRIWIHLSSFNNLYLQFSCHEVSWRLLSACLWWLRSSSSGAKLFRSMCTFLWLSEGSGIFLSEAWLCHLDCLIRWPIYLI